MSTANKGTSGPFGDPDGSRADIHDLLSGFVGFSGDPAFGDLRIGRHELQARAIVGGKGAGKSVYLRRLQADAEKQNGVYSEDTPVYADIIQRDVPTTESIVRICQWYPAAFLTEKWKWIWRRAIMRSLVSHLLCSSDLKTYVPDNLRDELDQGYPTLYGRFHKPLSIYSQVRHIINSHQGKAALSKYLEHPNWDDLEVTLGDVLRESPPVCFYIDAVDDEFAHAPMYWLICQKALFYEVMRLLREDQFGGRLHVMICIRDVVFSSVLRSEHASRYRESPHIRLLDWDRESLRYFLQAKLDGLPARFFPSSGGERSVATWLGTEIVTNVQREAEISEQIEDYLLRHIRPHPRDIVILGNMLCRGLDKARALGMANLPEHWISEIVAHAAKDFGDEQLKICANQMSADMLPPHAEQHLLTNVYTGADAYAPVLGQHLKDFLHSTVGRDRFDNGFCKQVAEQASREFSKQTDVLSVLWQNGLIGYGDGDIRGEGVTFYRLNDKSDDLTLPMDRDFYALHSCLIDSAGIEPVGPPVVPYRYDRSRSVSH